MANFFTDTTTVKHGLSGTGRYTRSLASSITRHHTVITPDQSWNPHVSHSSLYTGNYHKVLNLSLFANRPNVIADACFFPNYFMPPSWPYPSAVTIHDVSFLTHPQYYTRKMSTYYRMRIGHTVKKANLILTVSEASKYAIIRHLNVDAERIIVHTPAPPLPAVSHFPAAPNLPNGLNLPAASHLPYGPLLPAGPNLSNGPNLPNGPYYLSEDRHPGQVQPYLLYIGNIEPKKNTLRMVQAFANIGDKCGYKLLLIGKLSGPARWKRTMKQIIRDSEGVEWKGYLPDPELTVYLDNASCLILVSHVEGFGLPVMDALARNIPVLISRDPALNELADEAPIRADETRTDAIARGMERVIHSEASVPNTSGRIYKRFGRETYDSALDHITERILAKKVWFFPSDISNLRQSDSEKDLEEAILAAVCYAAVFHSGIHIRKLYHVLGADPVSYDSYRNTLEHMLNSYPELLQKSGETVSLKADMSHSETWENKIKKRDIRLDLQGLIRMILWIPWVRGLYYSGGTIHGSGLMSTRDLDLFVVTSGERAWIAYALIRLLARLSRTGHMLCANYILDEYAQEVHWQRDYYTAFQVLFLKKIALKDGTEHIRSYNRWVYDYFPNSPKFGARYKKPRNSGTGVMGLLNLMIMMLWTRSWKKQGKKSSSDGLLYDARRIKLHTNDHRPYISRTFSATMSKYLQKLHSARTDHLQESLTPL